MDFREKIEASLAPLVGRLREQLGVLPTLEVLNYYQLRIDLMGPDKNKVPDGFMFKCRFLWALLLSSPFVQANDDVDHGFTALDELIEEIFEVYSLGALWEPGRIRGSEKEFLARLGLGLRVREPDVLAFPEQIKEWACVRLEPFNSSFFLPAYGLSFEGILNWFASLLREVEERLNGCARELAGIYADVRPIQAESLKGSLTFNAARARGLELNLGERIERNRRQLENVHIFSESELNRGIPPATLQTLLKQFGTIAGEFGCGFAYPHDENPLEYKTMVQLPDGRYFFMDPANCFRVLAKTFEREILAKSPLRDRYLRSRDRAAERWVAELMRRVFHDKAVFTNYFLEKGGKEKDLLIRHGDSVILIECKNSRIRPFKGRGDDLTRFEEDFKNSIQFGYEQAVEVKRRILENEETTFFDEKGNNYFTIRRPDVKRFYIVCVTITPRGPFGTDLSYELKKLESEPFPLAINLFDFATICKHFNSAEQLIIYLREREGLHGRVQTGDELNFAGYFLKYGNLELGETTFLADDFSGIFDRAWYKDLGVDVEEPEGPPVRTSIARSGNRLLVQRGDGRQERLRVPAAWVERATGMPAVRMKGTARNKPCPCGSGRKYKHCHGV